MLSRLSLLLMLCILVGHVFAQKEMNNWYFGNNIGLNFNVSPPQKILNSSLRALEGCASISDAEGNLLFYTNGITVRNKLHGTLANGDLLMGDLSSTDNTIIVKDPGSDSLYYLFTVGAAGQHTKGLRYSIINIRKQNGLGEVISKNVLVHNNAYEKLAAVRHCNNTDVWITVKEWGSTLYQSFLLSASGLAGIPVSSNVGLLITGDDLNSLGTLKFSSDGKKLVAINSHNNDIAELMDFDNQAGTLSNPVYFKPNATAPDVNYIGIYGAAFSPGNKMLYISSKNGISAKSVLYQFDITTHDAAAILSSRYIVSQNSDWDAGGLQVGPDRKVYFAEGNNNSLNVINDPDDAGAACNYTPNAIVFGPPGVPSVQFGLPNFVAGDSDSSYAPFNFSWVQNSCNSFRVNFSPNRITGVDSIKWVIDDGFYSEDFYPVHDFAQPGNYQVSMTIFRQNCSGTSSVKITRIITVTGIRDIESGFLPRDTTICEASINFVLKSAVVSGNYLWNTGATTEQLNVQAPGIYWLEIAADGCIYRDSIEVKQQLPLTISLGNDRPVCNNKPAVLSINSSQPLNYLWSNGSTETSIEVNKAGIYWVKVQVPGGCQASDTLRTFWGDCDVYLPTAFSPNGDGVNEYFGLINGIRTTDFSFLIFNRYGETVFKTNDPLKKWDGYYKGKSCTIGQYVWTMTYTNSTGKLVTDKGTVLLVR